MPLKLPTGSTVKEVSATVSAQSGLEFTGKVTITVALPQLWTSIQPETAISADLDQELEKNFRNLLQAGDPELLIPDGAFIQFYDSVLENLTPAFTEITPAGYTIRVTFPSIDGRRSGDSVRLEKLEPPEFDWGSKLTKDTQIAHTLPKEAKIYATPEAFSDVLRKAFNENLASQVDAVRHKIHQTNTTKQKALSGTWEGDASQNIVDPSTFRLRISFSAGGHCTGKLSEKLVITGIGVSEIKHDLDFHGNWTPSSSGIEVIATQSRWFSQRRQIQGPDSDKPGIAKEESLTEEPFIMRFSTDRDGGSLTWIPAGSKVESASGSRIFAMIPIKLRKIAEEEPPSVGKSASPAPIEKPPIILKPKPINDELGQPIGESTLRPNGQQETSAVSPSPGMAEQTGSKFIKAPNIEDLPTFSPVTPPPSTRVPQWPSSPIPGEKFPETRLRQLKVEDVVGWNAAKIRHALNEMYARHGLTFKDKNVQAEFAKYKWYRPQPTRSATEIETAFTEIEHSNKELLAAVRQVAANVEAHRGDRIQQPEQIRSTNLPQTIYGPSDRFPDDVAGKGVAGRFFIIGTDMQGRPQLIPRSDAMNPFPRRFTLTETSLRDRPGMVLRMENYVPVDRPIDQPFIILKKDSGLGVYLIKDPFR